MGQATARAALISLFVLVLAAPAAALAQPPTPVRVDLSACPTAPEGFTARRPLERARAAVAEGRLTILALGSSSIEGVGASRPELSFTPLLQADLRRRLPGVEVTIHNRGIGGENAEGAVRRLPALLAETRPNLVLWQLSSNDVLQSRSEDAFLTDYRRGLDSLENAGVDVVLIDSQRLPEATCNPAFQGKNPTLGERARLIAMEADRRGHAVSSRFNVMSGWSRAPGGGIGPDDLHLNDAGYACWARMTAEPLTEALK